MAVRFEHVEDDYLDCPRNRQGQKRTHEAGELDAHEDGEQDEERIQFDGASIHGRLQHVILELLVEDKKTVTTIPTSGETRKPTTIAGIAPSVAPARGMRSAIATHSARSVA